MIRHFFRGLVAALLLVVHVASMATDIDLFVGATPSGTR